MSHLILGTLGSRGFSCAVSGSDTCAKGMHPHSNLTDFLEILPEIIIPGIMKNKRVRQFGYVTYFSSGVHLRNTSCIFLATPASDAET